LAHALRDGKGPLVWGLPAAIYGYMLRARAGMAPCDEHHGADHGSAKKRAPERRRTQESPSAGRWLVHSAVLLLLVEIRSAGERAARKCG